MVYFLFIFEIPSNKKKKIKSCYSYMYFLSLVGCMIRDITNSQALKMVYGLFYILHVQVVVTNFDTHVY